VADVATPMLMARQPYLVAPALLARPKVSDPHKNFRAIIIQILNKKD